MRERVACFFCQNRTEQQTAMWESKILCFTRARMPSDGSSWRDDAAAAEAAAAEAAGEEDGEEAFGVY